MIDLHCHILPELDDGARSIADSLTMAGQALDDGVTVVCATPHIRSDHRVVIEEIATMVASLQVELDAAAIAVRLVSGAELAATTVSQLTGEQLRLVSLGGTGGWVLLEPGPGPLDEGLERVVDGLAAHGLRALVAHPERHAGPAFTERLRGLVARGCLIQWTADFIARSRPADPVFDLARAGLVHVLGSDSHSSLGGRPVRLAAAYQRLEQVWGPDQLDWSVRQAPAAVLRGEPLTPPW